MTSTYRADQIGSLLRPKEVLDARAVHAEGKITLEQLREMEDRAILDALEQQKKAGIDVYTDGEMRRASFLSDLAESVEGFVREKIPMTWYGPGGGQEGSAAQVVGARLKQHRRLTAHETGFLKEHAPGPFKVTIPSATLFTAVSFKPGLTDRFYSSRSELLEELVRIVRNEVQALLDEGVPYVQVDAPRYTYYVDERLRQHLRESGTDPDQALDEAVAADNATVDGLSREGVTLGLHLCRGNQQGRWFAEGGYDPIAEKLFAAFEHDALLLEYDSERAGGFEPLRFVPKGKTVVLGLVTTKEERIESQDVLLRRIEEAARYVPVEHLALSPQCGFASMAPGNKISMDIQWRKLELIADTARKVWG